MLTTLADQIVCEYHAQAMAIRAELGLSANEWNALEHLAGAGALTASELARATGLASPTITSLTDRLERAGLITREPDPRDRRRRIARPSVIALEHVSKPSRGVGVMLHAALSSSLTPDEHAVVLKFVHAACQHMSHRRAPQA